MAGRPVRWRAAAMARWRIASVSRVGMPRSWRVKALRSDGQVVPSWVAAAYCSTSASDSTRSDGSAERSRGDGHDRHPLGWQPSRFLTDRTEAERAFQLAEQLGSVNAAAQELGTTWPSLRKAFQRHGLGMPTRNPEAVRQRSIAAASQGAGPIRPT